VEASRAACPDDVPEIARLARALRAELSSTRGGPVWSQREALPEPLDDAYATMLERDDAHVVVGTIDGVIVGFAAVVVETLHDGARLGVITDLYVEAGAREVGVGESMVAAVLAFCTEARCIGVDAYALPGNRAAKNFFEESGFTARVLVMHRSVL
jgi:ribosomal protein S18 acetylase RimI-like enzyme